MSCAQKDLFNVLHQFLGPTRPHYVAVPVAHYVGSRGQFENRYDCGLWFAPQAIEEVFAAFRVQRGSEEQDLHPVEQFGEFVYHWVSQEAGVVVGAPEQQLQGLPNHPVSAEDRYYS